MKIHRIELENLASLVGRHVVDLDEDLRSAPIFLVTGPTGAGKSTLLDAISLALFGTTPRLTTRRSGETTAGGAPTSESDARHIMSRGTANATACVEWSKLTPSGERLRYRATWSCERAHGQVDGLMGEPRRTLEQRRTSNSANGDETSFEMLVSDKRNKIWREPFLQALEGLEERDFQRSVLLAQGQFAAFLDADEAERAAILERLTDTERFTQVGKRAANKFRESKQRLDVATAKLAALLHEPFDLEKLGLALEQARKSAESAKVRLQAAEARFRFFQRQSELASELQQYEVLWANHQAQLAIHQPKLLRLLAFETASAALACSQVLIPLHASSKEVTERTKLLSSRLDDAVVTLAAQQHEHELALANSQQCEAHLELTTPHILALREGLSRAAVCARELENAVRRVTESEDRNQATLQVLEARRAVAEDVERRRVLAHHNLDEFASIAELEPRWMAIEDERRRLHNPELDLQARILQDELAAWQHNRSNWLSEQTAIATIEAETKNSLSTNLAQLLLEIQDNRSRLHEERNSQAEALAAQAADRQALRDRERRVLEAAELTRKRTTVRAKSAHLAVERQRVARVLATAEDRLEAVQVELAQLSFARGLLQERASLVPGTPCRVCGSCEHPIVTTESAVDREVDRKTGLRVAKLDLELSQLDEEVETARKRSGALDVERAMLDARAVEMERSLAALGDIAHAMPLPLEVAACEARGRELRRRTHEIDETLVQLTEHERALELQRLAVERSVRTLVERQGNHRAEAARLDTQEQALEARRAVLRQQLASRESDCQRLLSALESFDLVDVQLTPINASTVNDAIDIALVFGRTRLAQLEDARMLVTTTESLWTNIQGELAKLEAEAVAARDDALMRHDEANDRVLDHEDALREVSTLRRTYTLEGDPDTIELSLQKQVRAARKLATDLLAGIEQIRSNYIALQTEMAGEERQQLEIASKIALAERDLEGAMRRLGSHWPKQLGLAPSDVSSLEETRLEGDEIDHIRALRVELERTSAESNTRIEDSREMLRRHNATFPAASPAEGLPETVGASPTETANGVILADAAAEAERTTEHLAELRVEVRRAEELQLRYDHTLVEVNQIRREHDIASRLHQLIGVNDGVAFQRFAQRTHLDELVDRANAHLLRLSPRYTLAATNVGKLSLGFLVHDADMADEARPLTTLSGGETFLVSLALALSLADLRAAKIPIETLLLDEGFGVLDPNTLETAMRSLEALQGTGVQVGIVSHVEALRERIDAKIFVERAGQGRSQLRVEST